jgi:sorbitol-specific phosphotransferase system component IIBC
MGLYQIAVVDCIDTINCGMHAQEGVAEVALPANGPVGMIEYLLMDVDEQVSSL